jgi:hypothetical protein
MNLKDLKLTLLNPKQETAPEFHNKIYQHWKKIWEETLKLDSPLPSDAFMRQDTIYTLLENETVIGNIASILTNISSPSFTIFTR